MNGSSEQNRSKGFTQSAKIGGLEVVLTTSENDDGTLAFIQISVPKADPSTVGLINSMTAAVNEGLASGVKLEKFVEEFAFTKFPPSGLVVGNDLIKNCTSIADYIFRELAISYLGRTDLAHVDPGELNTRKRNNIDSENFELKIEKEEISGGILHKTSELLIATSVMIEIIDQSKSELVYSMPNDRESQSKYRSIISELDTFNRIIRKVHSNLTDILDEKSELKITETSEKLMTFRSKFVGFLEKNSDILELNVRMSMACGYVALFSIAGANMTVATPAILAVFGGSNVVQAIKGFTGKKSDKPAG